MSKDHELRSYPVRGFVVAVGMSLTVFGLLLLTSRQLNSWLILSLALWMGKSPKSHWPSRLHIIGENVLLGGILMVCIGWLVLSRWSFLKSLIQAVLDKKWALLLVSALLIVAVWLPVVLVGHSTSIAGERYWWLGDDAMISMRYARNLANGFGLVWNPSGERVEGYTNFLWTLYMAFVHLLPIPTPKISLVILLTNILLAIALIPVIIRLTRILGGDSFVTAATVAGYVLNEDTMFWTTAGFETPLLSLLFLLAIYRVIKEAQQGKPRLLTFLLVASISLVRADALVLSGLVYLLALLLHTKRKLVGIYSALSLALPLAHEIFRILYYGDILPNTAYLKTSGWDQRYKAGLEYVAEFARDYFVVIGLAVVGVFLARQRMQLSLLAAYLAYVAYIAYIGGDAFPHFRFFVPVLPLLLILAFLGSQTFDLTRMLRYLQDAFKRRSLRTVTYLALFISGLILIALSLVSGFMSAKAIQGLGTRAFLSLTLGFGLIIGGLVLSYRQEAPIHSLQQSNSLRALLLFLFLLSTPLIVPEHYRGFLESNAADIGNIRIGLLLKQNTLPDSKVADFWAGSVFYFSERYGIDLLGKSDRYIARLPVSSNGSKPGHNKFDFDYSLGVLKPDFVIANFSLPVQEKKMRRAATGDWAFTGQLYFHQVFREHCLRYPVNLRTWRTIFVCDWSPQVNNRNQWKELPHSVK